MNLIQRFPDLLISDKVAAESVADISVDRNGLPYKLVTMVTPKFSIENKFNEFTGKYEDTPVLLKQKKVNHIVHSHTYLEIAEANREVKPNHNTSNGGTAAYLNMYGLEGLPLNKDSLFYYDFSPSSPIQVQGAIIKVPCTEYQLPEEDGYVKTCYSRLMYVPYDVHTVTESTLNTYINSRLRDSKLEIDAYLTKEGKLVIPKNRNELAIVPAN